MRFEFQNLGMIKKTTLDLRPLTVILGPNNTNKTYLAYCVHGLMRSMAPAHIYDYTSGRTDVAIDLGEIAADTQAEWQKVAIQFVRQLPEYFQDTYRGLFQETILGVHVGIKDVRDALESLISAGDTRLALKGEQVVATKLHGRGAKFEARYRIVERVMQNITGAGVSLTLPAERNALIITYKILMARRFRVLRDRARAMSRERQLSLAREQGDIRYPAPIEDFLDFLTDVELDAARPKNDPQSIFGKLAHLIEQEIQGGHRTNYEATKFGGLDLAVTVNKDLVLDLYNASSSIKQIAPLLLYLRYRAAPNQTLIIDEPEMNLHPEAQAKLLEALAMLTNLGVRVLLTTHSPYFMAHLNNLIAADPASQTRRKRQAKHLYMGDPAAFLSPDDVSAYQMGSEGLTSLYDPEYGVRWDTLSDVSAELQRRFFAIVEEPKGRAKTA